MLSAEGTGKTIEKAIEEALLQLKAPREDVDIKILNEGGLFKKAKVLVSISEDAKDKYVKRAEKRKEEKVEVKPEPVKVQAVETKPKPKKDKTEVKEEVNTVETKMTIEKQTKSVDPMQFLEGFFKVLGKEVEISTLEDDHFITYNVTGENLGDVIGRRGETYYAITSLLLAITPRGDKKILLDIAGYKQKREESLAATAKRIADKVAKSGRYTKLEPMKPSERRIIHAALADDDRVTTLSKGTDPHRPVIVFPKEYKERF